MTAEDFLRAAALGVVEGLTEFLPISSTAHLIVANHFLGGEGEGAKVFEVAIQLGAILAVAWEYRRRLFEAAFHPARERSRRLLVNLFIAFLPAAILGVMLHGFIKEHLFDPRPAAFALAAGGAFLIWIEKKPRTATIEAVDSVGIKTAFWIGVAQSLALFPGVSRAAATIVGGLLCGLSRRAATEFSFLLALPTMFGAVLFDLAKSRDLLTWQLAAEIAVGFAVSFVFALLAIRGLLRFVSTRDFSIFGWYRIFFAAAVLAALSI